MTRPKFSAAKSLAVIVALRLSVDERERFQKAANKQGKTFAAWARDSLNAAAKGK